MATLELGRFIEGKLDERDKKGKPKHTLAALLAVDEGKKATDGQRFRSLAGMVTRKVRIGESGIWGDEEPTATAVAAPAAEEVPAVTAGAGEGAVAVKRPKRRRKSAGA